MNTDASKLYMQKKINMISIFLVLVGGINWLTAVFMKRDAVSTFLPKTLAKIVYVLVGLAALYLVTKRDVYLPFLGETVLPCAAFAARTPDNANQEITITTLPNTKVIYWASEPKGDASGNLEDWDTAYNEFTNSGVAISDEKGNAILRFRGKPQAYKVPFKGTIKPHVHFRICEKYGMIGPVQIYYLENGTIEKFSM
jgi:uncharacterized membrane protein YuzA (DUF378 family)